jgi:hypothetical protein
MLRRITLACELIDRVEQIPPSQRFYREIRHKDYGNRPQKIQTRTRNVIVLANDVIRKLPPGWNIMHQRTMLANTNYKTKSEDRNALA